MARITVVDDYPEFLETVSAILSGLEGHEVAGFDGKETTIDDMVASDPDLLIVDLHINGESGHGRHASLLAGADERLRHVPLIICSGDVERLRERASELAHVGTLTLEKPFGVEQLVAVVNQALNGQASGASGASPTVDSGRSTRRLSAHG